jgi:hypothetical protein
MSIKAIIAALSLFLGSKDLGAQPVPGKEIPKFMGHAVTIAEPKHDADGAPEGPASVCVEFVPQRQCYTAPKEFGNYPTVTVVQVRNGLSALFFSAQSYGVSGWQIHFALLLPGPGKNLQDVFLVTSVSNQSQHAFWTDTAISDAQMFVTATYVIGPDEGHYGEHRYIISAYVVSKFSPLYYLEDQYMTTRKYDLGAKADVLNSEKPEILARLRRIKAQNPRQ